MKFSPILNGYVVRGQDSNSGSPVFNSKTHKVEGILVKGSTDFISTIENCRISNPCPDSGCDGESVSRVSQFLSLLKF
jgi:hypothetical protein